MGIVSTGAGSPFSFGRKLPQPSAVGLLCTVRGTLLWTVPRVIRDKPFDCATSSIPLESLPQTGFCPFSLGS